MVEQVEEDRMQAADTLLLSPWALLAGLLRPGIVVPFLLLIGLKLFYPRIKGFLGEKTTQIGLALTLDAKTYTSFQNLVIETANGTTQIDHVYLSPYGLFVIETKNYTGWIFGDEHQKIWTQSTYGKKHTFQNPIHQNYRHTQALIESLKIAPTAVHPIIWFVGDVTLKTALPPYVLTSGIAPYIERFKQVVFAEDELGRIAQALGRLKAASPSARAHVRNLKERYASTTTCPKCGSPLVTRTAQRGPRPGSSFLACSAYPRCKYIK